MFANATWYRYCFQSPPLKLFTLEVLDEVSTLLSKLPKSTKKVTYATKVQKDSTNMDLLRRGSLQGTVDRPQNQKIQTHKNIVLSIDRLPITTE